MVKELSTPGFLFMTAISSSKRRISERAVSIGSWTAGSPEFFRPGASLFMNPCRVSRLFAKYFMGAFFNSGFSCGYEFTDAI